jgi:hypothetical protein
MIMLVLFSVQFDNEWFLVEISIGIYITHQQKGIRFYILSTSSTYIILRGLELSSMHLILLCMQD